MHPERVGLRVNIAHTRAMAGDYLPAKTLLLSIDAALLSQGRNSAVPAEAWIGLERVDDGDKIIQTDDALKLEARAVIACPDHVSFDAPDNREPYDYAVTPVQLFSIIDHKAMRRDIADVEVHIAMRKMLDDNRKVDRVARCTAHIGDA